MLDTRCSIRDQTQSDRAFPIWLWYRVVFEISVAPGVSPGKIQVFAAETAVSTEVKITLSDEIADARLSIAVDRRGYTLA